MTHTVTETGTRPATAPSPPATAPPRWVAPAAHDHDSLLVSLGRGAWPLLVAGLAGLAAGLAPALVGALLLGTSVFALLLVRLDLAVSVFVAASMFEGYLELVDARSTKLLAAVVVGSWVVMRCRSTGTGLLRTPVVLAAVSLWVVLLVSTLVNGSVDVTDVLLRWVGFLAVLVVLVDVMLRGLLDPRRLARTYVLAACAATAAGLVTFFAGGDRRAGGPIADPNDFAFYLLPALPLALALRRGGPRIGAYDVAAAVVVVGLVATLSRGALLGMAVMLVVAVVTRQVRPADLLGLGGVLLAAASAVFAFQREAVIDSLTAKSSVAGQNVSERFYLWDAASRMALDRPVLGHGPGSFATEHTWFTDQLPVDTRAGLDVAHNTYLEVAAELGLVGLAVFVTLLLLGLAGSWRAWRDGSRLGAAVASGLIGTSVAACFLSEQFFLPLWLLCAWGAVLPRLVRDRAPAT